MCINPCIEEHIHEASEQVLPEAGHVPWALEIHCWTAVADHYGMLQGLHSLKPFPALLPNLDLGCDSTDLKV